VAKTKGKSRKGRSVAAKPARTAKTAKPARPAKSVSTPVKAARAKVEAPALPPPPPPPPPPRDELPAPRDIARLLRYGEHFGDRKIDVRMLPQPLPVMSGQLAVFDPGVPKSWRVFDRPVGAGHFRVMVSIARTDGEPERLAAIVIHVGRPPIARWTVAHYDGQKKPRSADALPRCEVTTGWLAVIDGGDDTPGVVAVAVDPGAVGIQPIDVPLTDGRHALALPCRNGDYAAYWAVDATDKPICLVVDFDVFTQKEWKARPPG
jgi:hypothetical protein